MKIIINSKEYLIHDEIIKYSNIKQNEKINIPIIITDEIENLNFCDKFKFNINLLKCFNIDELQRMFNFICEIENIKLFKIFYYNNISYISDKYKNKYIKYLTIDDILTLSFEYLQTLKYNPTKYKCLDSLFGLKSDFNLGHILTLKQEFEKIINEENILLKYPDYVNYIIDLLQNPKDYYNLSSINNKNIKIFDDFKFMGMHRIDSRTKISLYGYLKANITYKFKWYEFVNWKYSLKN